MMTLTWKEDLMYSHNSQQQKETRQNTARSNTADKDTVIMSLAIWDTDSRVSQSSAKRIIYFLFLFTFKVVVYQFTYAGLENLCGIKNINIIFKIFFVVSF